MNLATLLMILWFPWQPFYMDSVQKLEVVWHDYPCDAAGAWTGPDHRIHLCPAPGDPLAWLWIHESQHILAGHNLPPNMDWKKFRRIALVLVDASDLTPEQKQRAYDVAGYGGHELHAELPWIFQGDIPSELQPWYPWFDLD